MTEDTFSNETDAFKATDELVDRLVTDLQALRRRPAVDHLSMDEVICFGLDRSAISEMRLRAIESHVESCVLCARELADLVDPAPVIIPPDDARLTDDADVRSDNSNDLIDASNVGAGAETSSWTPTQSRWRDHYYWLVRRYWRAVLHAPALCVVALSVCLIPALHFESILVALAVPLCVVAASVLTVRTLSIAHYADVHVRGRSGRESLWVISDQIETLFNEIQRMHQTADGVERELARIANGAHPWNQKRIEYTRLLGQPDTQSVLRRLASSLADFNTKKRHKFERIEAEKRLVASELEVSSYGLCEHFFLYIPRLHQRLISKYADNIHLLLRYGPNLQSVKEVERVSAIVRQNNRLRLHHVESVAAQIRLKHNEDLLDTLVELARSRSTSHALGLYAELIGQVAVQQLAHFAQLEWDGNTRHPSYQECEAQLKFLHRKQRAHGGADLTMTLVRALEAHDPEGRSPESRGIAFVMRRLASHWQHRRDPILVADPNTVENVERVISGLSALQRTPLYAELALETARWRTIATFEDVAAAGLFETSGDVWLVTHGMSRMVRDVLKHGLARVMGRRIQENESRRVSAEDLTPDERRTFEQAMPRVYLLQLDDQGRADAAQMDFELKEQRDVRAFASVSTGDLDVLADLTGAEDRVVVLLGADSFDRDGRVLQTRGQGKLVAKLVQRVRSRKAECVVVVLAQAFKLSAESLAASGRLNNHFDKMSSYSGDEIDLVISEGVTYARKGSEMVKRLRLEMLAYRWLEADARVARLTARQQHELSANHRHAE